MPGTKAEEEPTTGNLHSEDRYYDQVQVYLPAKQDPTYRVKGKVTQQTTGEGGEITKTKIVDTKMRNKKTRKNESPSMESWNRIGERPCTTLKAGSFLSCANSKL